VVGAQDLAVAEVLLRVGGDDDPSVLLDGDGDGPE
jgi:hypothetical protein